MINIYKKSVDKFKISCYNTSTKAKILYLTDHHKVVGRDGCSHATGEVSSSVGKSIGGIFLPIFTYNQTTLKIHAVVWRNDVGVVPYKKII
jgi:hypothetical protein